MKKFTRIVALALVVLMTATMAIGVFAGTDPKPGKITVLNAVKDTTYYVYKIFDATVDTVGEKTVVSYTNNGTAIPSTNLYFKQTGKVVEAKDAATDEDGNLVPAAIEYLESLIPTTGSGDSKQFNTAKAVASKKCEDGKAIVIDNLDYGYYYVTTGIGSVATIDSAAKTVVIYDKNDYAPGPEGDDPTAPTKTIEDSDRTDKSKANVAYKDEITFFVDFLGVNYVVEDKEVTQVYKYVLTDTPSDLDVDWSKLEIYVGKEGETDTANMTKLTKDTNYTVSTATGVTTITILWAKGASEDVDHDPLYANPTKVHLEYPAVVDSVDGGTNKLSYKFVKVKATESDPEPEPEEFPDDETLPEEEAEALTYSLTVKYFTQVGSNTPVTSSAGTFKLYDAETAGNQIPLFKISDGKYRVWLSDDGNDKKITDAIAMGDTEIVGLAPGSYYVEQVAAASGFNALSARQDGSILTGDDAEDATVEITNQAGTVLPATGSTGTALLISCGVVAVLGAGLFLVTNKRMSKEEI